MQAAPTILKSAFLEPISSGLASQLSLDLFARADKDFMQMFAGLWNKPPPPPPYLPNHAHLHLVIYLGESVRAKRTSCRRMQVCNPPPPYAPTRSPITHLHFQFHLGIFTANRTACRRLQECDPIPPPHTHLRFGHLDLFARGDRNFTRYLQL